MVTCNKGVLIEHEEIPYRDILVYFNCVDFFFVCVGGGGGGICMCISFQSACG